MTKTVICYNKETFSRMSIKELISCAYEGDLLARAREIFEGSNLKVIGLDEVCDECTAIKCHSEETAAAVAAQLEEAGIGFYWRRPGTHPGLPGDHWLEVDCAFPECEVLEGD